LDLDEESLSLMENGWTWMKKHSASWEMFELGLRNTQPHEKCLDLTEEAISLMENL
jgi:hypothetical protein